MEKYIFGSPIETEAVIEDVPAAEGLPAYGEISAENGKFRWTVPLEKKDVVYGLGETVRGINKRGWEYTSWATDDPVHDEDKRSLYSAHNFLIVDPGADSDRKPFGIFIDQPGEVHLDIGYSRADQMVIACDGNLKVYVIDGDSPYEISRKFRKMIGQSYLAPKFAFGYGQSRWGYRTQEDFFQVLENLENCHIPVDLIYMDIDYMQDFKDFTLHRDEFEPSFQEFVAKMKDRKIHLVPIIDAGVKKEEGYPVYEEGVRNNYFCKMKDHQTDFVGAVWPGYALFPDFLNDEARDWFGMKYHVLTDAGIDAFWNDMNEPALFYSENGMKSLKEYLASFAADPEVPRNCYDTFTLTDRISQVKNSMADYRSFDHNMNGTWVSHERVHNLYGYKMTQAASDAFKKLRPNERTLMFSRSSYIGAHRHGGIWTGDNKSWWSHLDLIVHQLPALNMCGFVYTGADLGGFGADTTRDLLLRFLQIGLFTPLMRNHAALGTREQEPYQFEHPEDFAFLIQSRYRLIPYLYSEYLKAVLDSDLMFRPLSFDYPEDPLSTEIEDQLMLGHEVMIAPVTKQNTSGRMVYLPEDMMEIRLSPSQEDQQTRLEKGWHYIRYPENEVVFFIRNHKAIPLAAPADRVDEIDVSQLRMTGYPEAEYELLDDDGISLPDNNTISSLSRRTLKAPAARDQQ